MWPRKTKLPSMSREELRMRLTPISDAEANRRMTAFLISLLEPLGRHRRLNWAAVRSFESKEAAAAFWVLYHDTDKDYSYSEWTAKTHEFETHPWRVPRGLV